MMPTWMYTANPYLEAVCRRLFVGNEAPRWVPELFGVLRVAPEMQGFATCDDATMARALHLFAHTADALRPELLKSFRMAYESDGPRAVRALLDASRTPFVSFPDGPEPDEDMP